MSKVTLSVPGISCGHCVNTVERELAMVAGVEAVKADLGSKLVTFNYRDEATLAEARKTLVEIGYPAA